MKPRQADHPATPDTPARPPSDSGSVSAKATNWFCRLGRHHFRSVNQDNPENRQYQYRECVTCGKLKEGPSADFSRTDRPFMGGGGLAN